MQRRVYIHANETQWIGALLAAYALRRNSANPDEFDVQFLQVKHFDFLKRKDGQPFLRGGTTRTWHIERRLRGREEHRKLQLADWVLISLGKSGRTVFRVMLSRFNQLKHQLPIDRLLEFDNLHRMQPAVYKVLFSYNN